MYVKLNYRESFATNPRNSKGGIMLNINTVFLPVAEPTGHRTVRVVVFVGGGTTLMS